jgi:hypothetical protein
MRVCAIFLLFIFFFSLSAKADDLVDEQARVHFSNGVKLYKKSNFAEALEEFQQAYQLRPSYKIMYNIGQTYIELEKNAEALEAFEGYLLNGSDKIEPERKHEVELEISRLRTVVGELQVIGQAGAQCWIDGKRIGFLPLTAPVRLSAGIHHIEVHIPDAGVCEKKVTITGQRRRIEYCTKIAGSAGPPEPPSAWDAMTGTSFSDEFLKSENDVSDKNVIIKKTSFLDVAPWITTGMGITSLTAWIVAGVTTAALNRELGSSCKEGVCPPGYSNDIDRLHSFAVLSDTMMITTAVLGVTSLILFIAKHKKKRKESQLTNINKRGYLAFDMAKWQTKWNVTP